MPGSAKCEDCGLKCPSYGLPTEGRKRWCAVCGRRHAGAQPLNPLCEDCSLKRPSYGLPSESVRRWCAGCSKLHAGARLKGRMCEHCGTLTASFGLLSEGSKRWCQTCSKRHVGAYPLHNANTRSRCEDCFLKPPSYGLPSEGTKRWCAGCSKWHIGAQSLRKQRKYAARPGRRRESSRVTTVADPVGLVDAVRRAGMGLLVPGEAGVAILYISDTRQDRRPCIGNLLWKSPATYHRLYWCLGLSCRE
eukprot:COSAG01_NODE_13649_length_1553_cov_3.482118_2_plen_248_part_00